MKDEKPKLEPQYFTDGTSTDAPKNNLKEEPILVAHSELERFSETSIYKSICPKCKEGLLLVTRNQDTLKIRKDDMCVLCGQRFIYTDVDTIGVTEMYDPEMYDPDNVRRML